MDEKQVRKPATLGPVAEGQLELNRELTRRAPEASRDHLLQEQEALQRAQPDVVHAAAARSAGRRDVAGTPPEGLDRESPPAPSEADAAAPGAEPAVRSPFADAAVATRDPRSEAG